MLKRNLMISYAGGSFLVVSDTLHEQNNDYVEIARIDKTDGKIMWNITTELDTVNENKNNDKNYIGTVKEVVERFSNRIKTKEGK